jgi:iron complex transport system substrate-binding protein
MRVNPAGLKTGRSIFVGRPGRSIFSSAGLKTGRSIFVGKTGRSIFSSAGLKTGRSIGLAVLMMAVGAAAVSPDALPDAQDRAPERIISLVPAATEMLFAFGAGEQVVGVSSFARYPPEAREKTSVGALVDPDVERILSLRPDLVVVYGTQSDLIARLSRADVPLFTYAHASLSDVTETMRQLGARIGREAEAARTVEGIEAAIEDVRQRVAGRPRPRTALVIGREPDVLRGIYVSAGFGFMHDMLEAAGGADAFGDVMRQSLQVSAEMMLARRPEVILETHPPEGWTPARLARERQVWNVLAAIPAVQSGRVHILADDVLLVPGPRVAEGIRLMAETLHPEAFRSNLSPFSARQD